MDFTYEAISLGLFDRLQPGWTFQRVRHTIHQGVYTNPSPGFMTDLPVLSHNGWLLYKITGVAVDQNEDPLSGADVYLLKGDLKGGMPYPVQKTVSGADGSYIFYVEDDLDEYVVMAWKWDGELGEYIRGVTDRDLKPVAS